MKTKMRYWCMRDKRNPASQVFAGALHGYNGDDDEWLQCEGAIRVTTNTRTHNTFGSMDELNLSEDRGNHRHPSRATMRIGCRKTTKTMPAFGSANSRAMSRAMRIIACATHPSVYRFAAVASPMRRYLDLVALLRESSRVLSLMGRFCLSELVCSLASSLNSGSVPKRHGLVWAETGANREEEEEEAAAAADATAAAVAAEDEQIHG